MILNFRYIGLKVKDFEIKAPRLILACGNVQCDANHLINDPSGKLCISYGGDTALHRWALAGKILLQGNYQDIPPIVFHSHKMAQLFCSGIANTKPYKAVNPMMLAQKVKDVLQEYEDNDIGFDLVFWCKFSIKG